MKPVALRAHCDPTPARSNAARLSSPPLAVLSLAVLPLAACMAAPAAPPPAAPVVVASPGIVPVAGVAGLEAREPDACHAKDYLAALGQPAGVIPTLGITRPYRVVEYRGIEPQEYDALRIVFRLDAGNNIYNIDCG